MDEEASKTSESSNFKQLGYHAEKSPSIKMSSPQKPKMKVKAPRIAFHMPRMKGRR